MFSWPHKLPWLYGLIAINLTIAPAMAEVANFNPLTLGGDINQDQASGNAGGNYSFLSLSNSDRDGNFCLGFGSNNPDHLLEITNKQEVVNLVVENRGEPYAIVVKTPSNDFICALDEDLEISNASKGEYQVWIGAEQAAENFQYRLVAEVP